MITDDKALFGGIVVVPTETTGSCNKALWGGPYVVVTVEPPLGISVAETIDFAEEITPLIWDQDKIPIVVVETINFQEVFIRGPLEVTIVETLLLAEGGRTDALNHGTPTASSFYPGYPETQACDDNDATKWSALTEPAWWQYDFGSLSPIITRLRITAPGTIHAEDAPKDFTLKASNTGAFGGEEVTLLTKTDQHWTDLETKEWVFENATGYRYYRINITATDGAWMAMAEVEMLPSEPGAVLGTVLAEDSESLAFQEYVEIPTNFRDISIEETISFAEQIVRQVGDVPAEVIETLSIQTEAISGIGDLSTEVAEGLVFQSIPEASVVDLLASVEETLSFLEYTEIQRIAGGEIIVTGEISFQEEITAALGELQRSFEESLAFEESILRELGSLNAQASEDLAFQEQVERQTGTVLVSVYETIQLEESPQVVAVNQFLAPSIHESIQFEEAPQVIIWTQIVYPIVAESIFFSEFITREMTGLLAQTVETVAMQEGVIPKVDAVKVSVEETISFNEPVEAVLSVPIRVEETLSFNEGATRQLSALSAVISDTVSMIEAVGGKLGDLTTSRAETINFAEDLKPAVAQVAAAVDDALGFAETVASSLSAVGARIQEELVVEGREVIHGLLTELKTAVVENINFTEVIGLERFGPIYISIVENIQFTEAILPQVMNYSPAVYKAEYNMGPDKTSFVIQEQNASFVLPQGEET